jgi:Alpha amylase, catalytic domain
MSAAFAQHVQIVDAAIIYQLHVKAFVDSNHDGIGDFGGLTEKLDYLQDLGITALWLLPFYPPVPRGSEWRDAPPICNRTERNPPPDVRATRESRASRGAAFPSRCCGPRPGPPAPRPW